MSSNSRREDGRASAPKPLAIDDHLLDMGLLMTPAQRLRWLEETVEELLPWVGLAAKSRPSTGYSGSPPS